MQGTIAMLSGKGFGFIRPKDATDSSGDHFFHVDDLRGGLFFDHLVIGTEVEFESKNMPTGLRAGEVHERTN